MTKGKEMFYPHMPEVYIHKDIESVFKRARTAAAEPTQGEDGIYRRQIIIVTPGRLLIGKDCPLAAELSPEQLAVLEKLVPRKPTLQICAIAYTLLEALKTDMRRAIPFIDYLLGFAALGHTVWAFEGHAGALSAGCRDADLLLVDSGMLPELEKNQDWREQALSAMRGQDIKLISRADKGK
jgi:hypothetical protein